MEDRGCPQTSSTKNWNGEKSVESTVKERSVVYNEVSFPLFLFFLFWSGGGGVGGGGSSPFRVEFSLTGHVICP